MFNLLPCIIFSFFSNTYSCSLIVSILNIDRRRYSLHGSSYNVYLEIYEYTNNIAGLYLLFATDKSAHHDFDRLLWYSCLFQGETFILFVTRDNDKYTWLTSYVIDINCSNIHTLYA